MSQEKHVARFKAEGYPETAYGAAMKEWDERIGSARVQAYNWRLAFFIVALLSVGLSGGVVFMGLQKKVVPYVVQVDKLGRVQTVDKVVNLKVAPGQAATRYFLAGFVVKVRSLPLDPVVLKKNWLTAYNFVTQKGENHLNNLANKEKPFSRVGKETVAVDIENVIKMSSTSYQVSWSEKGTNQYGTAIGTERYTGGISTVHAHGARQSLTRLEQLIQEVVVHVPRGLIAEAVDVIV